MTIRWPLAGLLVAASAAFVPVARAQGIDLSHGGPINITARDGIQWLQQQHEVIANGDARAVRQNVTVTADRLIAFYRKRQGAAAPAAARAPTPGSAPEIPGDPGGENEIYRLEAEGRVVITTPTDRATADKAVYDIDKAVLVLTGRDLRLTTPNDVLTARDDLEYWSAKHMAVARGDAVVVTKDNRRVAADVLVAYTEPSPQPAGSGAKPVPAGAQPQDDPLEGGGKLQKVEAFGHVAVSTPTDVVTGDRGVYTPDDGIAVLLDHVQITHGNNELTGAEARVNLKTGVAQLVAASKGRVSGLLIPNEAPQATPAQRQASAPARGHK